MIDWTTATPDELAELYDALYERNDHIQKAFDQIHMRMNGERMRKWYAMQSEVRTLSYEMSQQIHTEMIRRRNDKHEALSSQ
jgi:hypothetical protein